MSSAAADGADSGGSSRHQAPTTYWCHECDMSVSLLFSSPPLVCPQCHGDFLEEMEGLHHHHHRRRRRHSPAPPFRHGSRSRSLYESRRLLDEGFDHLEPDDPDDSDSDPLDSSAQDYYEVFDRLIGHIVSSASDDPDDQPSGGPTPASKSSVEAIPTLQITAAFLAADPSLLCAVCKDEFILGTEARQMPCSHIYHPDCILPWLTQHNSCPVCRFRLPTEDQDRRRRPGRADQAPVLFGNLLEEDGAEEVERDVHEIGSMINHLVRRHRSVFPGRPSGLSIADGAAAAGAAEGDLVDVGSVLTRIARRHRLAFSRRSLRPSVVDAGAAGVLRQVDSGAVGVLRRVDARTVGVLRPVRVDLEAVSPTQMAQAEMSSDGPANSAETVSSGWPPDEGTSMGGGGGGRRVDDEGDVVMSEARGSSFD